MASAAVMAAVEARVAAHWTATPIQGLNGGGSVPRRNSAFLTIEYPVAEEEQISIGAPGSNLFRETGVFRVVLSIPAGAGLSTWPAQLDLLRASLRGQNFDGLITWAVSPATTNDRSDIGAYFQISFATPYEHDVLA